MDNGNSYFDNGLCSTVPIFGNFKVKNHNLIKELEFMRDTFEDENKEYLELAINRWINEIESLPDDEKEAFKEMDMWMFLMIVFTCDGFSENGFANSDIVRTFLNFKKYVKENGVVQKKDD